MTSIWRRVMRSKKDHEAASSHSGSSQSGKKLYQHEDQTASAETRLHYLNNGQGMQMLRRVHLIDPLQVPSWSGVQRSTPDVPSILHLIEAETCKVEEASEILSPGIIELTFNPEILCVRGLLLDTIKHVGVLIEHNSTNEQCYKPPKWLTKLAITKYSAALRDVSVNIVANPERGSLKSRISPQAALQEKYDEFMAFIFSLVGSYSKQTRSQTRFDDVSMCVTEAGYFGIVPPSAKAGDILFMVEQDPLRSIFIVRKHLVHGFYLWNGLVYIHHMAQQVDNAHATDRILVG